MVGYDPAANDFNFYLLAFESQDLLSERMETGWAGWTLYTDHDLEDTPLDCTSCHRPEGPDAHRRLLMRQFGYPWLQWGDFRGLPPPVTCTDATGAPTLVDVGIQADGADLLRAIDGELGRHGGIPVTELLIATSGYHLSSFISYAARIAQGIDDVACAPPDCPFSEPHPFPTHDVLCDQLQHGRADVAGGAWGHATATRYRRADSRRRSSRTMCWMPASVPRSAPTSTHSLRRRGPAAMRSRCCRGWSGTTHRGQSGSSRMKTMPPRRCWRRCAGAATARAPTSALARARFDATALERLDAATAAKVVDRIAPRTSPDRMPPLRSGELPDWATARITELLTRSRRPSP